MKHNIFIWTSPFPLLIFWGLSIYVNRFEGWGQWAAAPMLLIPIFLSLLMGGVGVVLIVQARKQRAPTANLWASTLMASSLFLYYLVKGILL